MKIETKSIKEKINHWLEKDELSLTIKKYINKENFVPRKDFLSKKMAIFFIVVLLLIILGDQVTKRIVSTTIEENDSIAVINNFFYFTYTNNKGAAWSMLEGHLWLFYIVTIIALIAIYSFFLKTKEHELLTRFGLVLVTAGAIGNFTDRLFFGYVRDFLHFQLGSYDFPVFNIADMAIVIGVFVVVIEMVMEEYEIWKISKSL